MHIYSIYDETWSLFILGGQKIIRRKEGMVESLGEMRKGEERGTRKGAEREDRYREKRERDIRELGWHFEEEVEEHTTCLFLLFSFLKAMRYSSDDMSSRLDCAVKRCSNEVLISSGVA